MARYRSELSAVVQQAQEQWMLIPLDKEYYTWIATIDADWTGTAWKDMTDAQAQQAYDALKAFYERRG